MYKVILLISILFIECKSNSDFDKLLLVSTKNTPQELGEILTRVNIDTSKIVKLDTTFIGPAKIWAFLGNKILGIRTNYEVLFSGEKNRIYSVIIWLDRYDSTVYEQLIALTKQKFDQYEYPGPEILTDSLQAIVAHDSTMTVVIALSNKQGLLKPIITLNKW
jgi:hypothetical protein